MEDYKKKIWSALITLLVMLLLFLLLWFVYMDQPYVPEDEGIEVVFEDGMEGAGSVSEPEVATSDAVAAAPAAPVVTPPTDNLVVSDESELALQRQRREAERRRHEEEEAERRRQEEEARLQAERQAKTDKANAAMAGMFGGGSGNGGGTGNASGATAGAGSNPVGKGYGTSGGNSWSLKGRDLRGNLATPNYNSNSEGTVVVEIRVDKNGNVISARRGQGTNTGDQALIDAACAAARTAKFSPAPDGQANDVVGSITYVFKVK